MKHLIIAGGNGGIGSEISSVFIKKKYYITILGRNRNNYKKFIKKKKLDFESNIRFVKIDVSNYSEVKNFFSTFESEDSKKKLCGLINVFGIQAPIGDFTRNDINEWHDNIKINLLGTVNMCRAFLDTSCFNLNRKKIINFSGGGATFARPNFSAYSVAKAGIVKFTEVLSKEMNNADINVVAPGSINTKMLDEVISAGKNAGSELNDSIRRKMKGGDSCKNIVNLCSFLLSKKSDNITGKLLSAIWDDITSDTFVNRLKNDLDFCTLRRIDSYNYESIC